MNINKMEDKSDQIFLYFPESHQDRIARQNESQPLSARWSLFVLWQRSGVNDGTAQIIISSDVALLVTFNQAIDGVLKNNQKARQNPKALAQRDGYKRGLVNSLTGNLQHFGFAKTSKVETLQENNRRDDGEGPGSGDDSMPPAGGA